MLVLNLSGIQKNNSIIFFENPKLFIFLNIITKDKYYRALIKVPKKIGNHTQVMIKINDYFYYIIDY